MARLIALAVAALDCGLLALVGTACSASSSPGSDRLQCGGSSTVPWASGVWTQPVPAWGSSVRLNLPLPLDQLEVNLLGAFGSHQGGHPEGMDHVWLQSATDTTVQNMAPGTVSRIDGMGSDGIYVTVDYGHRLLGKHMGMKSAKVMLGDVLAEGDTVGVGNGITHEYTLMDQNRCDGVLGQVGGYSYVSPFDYLKSDVLAALLDAYQTQIVQPDFSQGQSGPTANPWEPYFTNRTLFHSEHPGTIVGEWILANKGWSTPDPLYYDLFTVEQVDNAYGHFQRFAVDDDDLSRPGAKNDSHGTWSLPDASGRIIFTPPGNGAQPWYGLFQIDESGPRAKLTLEWSTSDYPAALSPDAAVYYARLNVYRRLDASLLGRLPSQ